MLELLVVIVIIGVLAALLLPAGAGVWRKAKIKRAEGELAQLETAISRYKTDTGFYPRDNPAVRTATEDGVYASVNTPAAVNPLYYELQGARVVDSGNLNNLVYETLGSAERVTTAALADPLRGFGVKGIMNTDFGGRNKSAARNYLPDLKPAQHSNLNSPPVNNPPLQVLSVAVKGPAGEPSRFCYVSSSPSKKPEAFDLWVDVVVGGKTNRISNWSDEPEVVSY